MFILKSQAVELTMSVTLSSAVSTALCLEVHQSMYIIITNAQILVMAILNIAT
jgi:hypothetical protein